MNAFPGDVVRRGAGDAPGALVDVQCIPCMSGTKLPFQGKCSGGAQLVGGRCRERQRAKRSWRTRAGVAARGVENSKKSNPRTASKWHWTFGVPSPPALLHFKKRTRTSAYAFSGPGASIGCQRCTFFGQEELHGHLPYAQKDPLNRFLGVHLPLPKLRRLLKRECATMA